MILAGVGGEARQVVVGTYRGPGGRAWQEIRGSFTDASLVVGFGTRLVGAEADSDVGAQLGSLQNVFRAVDAGRECDVFATERSR